MPARPLRPGQDPVVKLCLLAAALALAVPGSLWSTAITEPASPSQLPNAKEMADLRREVETLRGKKFLHDVPAREVSEKELRALVDRDLAKDYPGRKLTDLQALMVWLDLLPPKADLRTICEDLLVGDVAGLYDTETKTMCIPSPAPVATNRPAGKHPPQKKVEDLSGLDTGIVFAHEYTHALEDQYWPIDPPELHESRASTDTDVARTFLVEGSATRLMIGGLTRPIREPQAGHLCPGLEPAPFGPGRVRHELPPAPRLEGPGRASARSARGAGPRPGHALLVRLQLLHRNLARLGPRWTGLHLRPSARQLHPSHAPAKMLAMARFPRPDHPRRDPPGRLETRDR